MYGLYKRQFGPFLQVLPITRLSENSMIPFKRLYFKVIYRCWNWRWANIGQGSFMSCKTEVLMHTFNLIQNQATFKQLTWNDPLWGGDQDWRWMNPIYVICWYSRSSIWYQTSLYLKSEPKWLSEIQVKIKNGCWDAADHSQIIIWIVCVMWEMKT